MNGKNQILFFFFVVLVPAIAGAQQTMAPAAANVGPGMINPAPPVASVSPPLAYPTTHTETAARVEELLSGAAALVAQGNLSKAMESYNEALRIAPQYAEAYRQRALTLLRLGDRVRAQVDYARFLALDPQSRNRVHEEVQLFETSGYTKVGETVGPPYGAASLGAVAAPGVIVGDPNQYLPTRQSDMDYTMAREAFLSGDYRSAFRWAQWADEAMPQARIHALKAQILLAEGAIAAPRRRPGLQRPWDRWSTGRRSLDTSISGRPSTAGSFMALEQYVRQNPSSADARFLLGYEHLVLGQAEPAHAQLAIAAVLEPLDVVARNMLAHDGVEIVGGQPSLTKNMMQGGGVVITAKTPLPPTPGQPGPVSATAQRQGKEVKR